MKNKVKNVEVKKKLNLGCGDHVLTGYENFDIKTGGQAYPLIGPDGVLDEIRASHLLEHFAYEKTADVLANWVSKLKPGGVLKIAVPDFGKISENYDNGNTTSLEQYIMGGHIDQNDHHKAIFDYGKLMDMMQNAGLVDVGRWESEIGDCASLDISLNLMGTKFYSVESVEKAYKPERIKPFNLDDQEKEKTGFDQVNSGNSGSIDSPGRVIGWENTDGYEKGGLDLDDQSGQAEKVVVNAHTAPDKPIRIQAVMSMPRVAFTENLFCAMSAFHPLGINVERATGAFWEQGLTRMMERFTNDGFDCLITIDYDTYYTRDQVVKLCQLAVENPDVDAIVSMQAKREEDVMLMGWKTPDGMDPSDFLKEEIGKKELVDIITGHFGLTIIKCEALKTIGKPWFNSTPGPDGSWNDDRVDSDISFWHNMKRCGKRVCLAPGIKIGHLQQLITYPGTIKNGLHPEHHYIADIRRDGLPEHCRIVD